MRKASPKAKTRSRTARFFPSSARSRSVCALGAPAAVVAIAGATLLHAGERSGGAGAGGGGGGGRGPPAWFWILSRGRGEYGRGRSGGGAFGGCFPVPTAFSSQKKIFSFCFSISALAFIAIRFEIFSKRTHAHFLNELVLIHS